MALTYAFDHVHTEEPRRLTALLGGKGANLAQMASRLNMPVPPGFTVTTDAWRAFEAGGWPEGLDEEIRAQIAAVERRLDRRFGDPAAPLLLSVRSGAPQSMPGMMDTVLNLGAGEGTLPGLTAFGGEVFALDTYRRFLGAYAGIVLGIPPAEFQSAEPTSDPATLRAACDGLLAQIEAHSGQPLSPDPWDHLQSVVEAVFRSWHGPKARSYRQRVGLPDNLGTAANVQAMVFGNKDARSAKAWCSHGIPLPGRITATATFSSRIKEKTSCRAHSLPNPTAPLPTGYRRPLASLRNTSTDSRSTTGICATSSSRSNRASCGFFRHAWASLRPPRLSESRST